MAGIPGVNGSVTSMSSLCHSHIGSAVVSPMNSIPISLCIPIYHSTHVHISMHNLPSLLTLEAGPAAGEEVGVMEEPAGDGIAKASGV